MVILFSELIEGKKEVDPSQHDLIFFKFTRKIDNHQDEDREICINFEGFDFFKESFVSMIALMKRYCLQKGMQLFFVNISKETERILTRSFLGNLICQQNQQAVFQKS